MASLPERCQVRPEHPEVRHHVALGLGDRDRSRRRDRMRSPSPRRGRRRPRGRRGSSRSRSSRARARGRRSRGRRSSAWAAKRTQVAAALSVAAAVSKSRSSMGAVMIAGRCQSRHGRRQLAEGPADRCGPCRSRPRPRRGARPSATAVSTVSKRGRKSAARLASGSARSASRAAATTPRASWAICSAPAMSPLAIGVGHRGRDDPIAGGGA